MQTVTKLIFFAFTLFSYTLYSQISENFEKGSYQLYTDEIVEGFIKTEDFKTLTTSICFKKSLSDKNCERLDAQKIKSFQTENGKYFELMTFKTDNGTNEHKAFASLLVDGETLLYKSFYNSLEIYIIKYKSNNKTYVLQKDQFKSGDLKITKNYFERTLNMATEGFSGIQYPKLIFKEQQFVDIILAYNQSKGIESKEFVYKEKNNRFIILSAGHGSYQDDKEHFVQAMQRIYYPKLSRSTSLNMGLSYYRYQENNDFGYSSSNRKIVTQLYSAPVLIQQNILNKKFRPYLFLGLNFSLITKEDALGRELLKIGFQENYGIGYLYGGGVEVDIAKRFFIKGEYRQEAFQHALLFGISYYFKR
jgi:opacity protein-like surface antigen